MELQRLSKSDPHRMASQPPRSHRQRFICSRNIGRQHRASGRRDNRPEARLAGAQLSGSCPHPFGINHDDLPIFDQPNGPPKPRSIETVRPDRNPSQPPAHLAYAGDREQVLTAQERDSPRNSRSEQRNIQKTRMVGCNQQPALEWNMFLPVKAKSKTDAADHAKEQPQAPINKAAHCFDTMAATIRSTT